MLPEGLTAGLGDLTVVFSRPPVLARTVAPGDLKVAVGKLGLRPPVLALTAAPGDFMLPLLVVVAVAPGIPPVLALSPPKPPAGAVPLCAPGGLRPLPAA